MWVLQQAVPEATGLAGCLAWLAHRWVCSGRPAVPQAMLVDYGSRDKLFLDSVIAVRSGQPAELIGSASPHLATIPDVGLFYRNTICHLVGV